MGQVGKRTPVFARFSTVAGEQGYADTVRDPRGFSLKFYTDEGNFDMVGNNTPVFFVRDASKFQNLIHSQKRQPDTGLREWDFWTLSPESAHQVAIFMSDRGTPRSYRTMNGFGSHTYSTVNAAGVRFWVKYHFTTVQGIENFTDSEAKAMTAEDPDFTGATFTTPSPGVTTRSGGSRCRSCPTKRHSFNPFDLTKVWPHADYPLIPVGRVVLSRNPANFFAEVEQAAFSPANLVPGTGLSPDRMLMGRVFSYHDTHLHRIGPNYEQLPINAPLFPGSSLS